MRWPTSRQFLHRVRPANHARFGFGTFLVIDVLFDRWCTGALSLRVSFSCVMDDLVCFHVARTSIASLSSMGSKAPTMVFNFGFNELNEILSLILDPIFQSIHAESPV